MAVLVRVHVLLFARLRDLAGARELDVDVAEGATARDVWAASVVAHPRLGAPSPPPRDLRVAVDERYAAWETPVAAGATIAFIPPVAGGSDGVVLVRLSGDRLDARELERAVRGDADGAVCTFTGVVRDHNDGRSVSRLEYEAYAAMAEAEMRRIGEAVLETTGARALAMAHRVGSLAIGEASVVVSAAAAHRAEAFAACRLAIDTLKAEVPIWKREHGDGGAVWVGDAGLPRSDAGGSAPAGR